LDKEKNAKSATEKKKIREEIQKSYHDMYERILDPKNIKAPFRNKFAKTFNKPFTDALKKRFLFFSSFFSSLLFSLPLFSSFSFLFLPLPLFSLFDF